MKGIRSLIALLLTMLCVAAAFGAEQPTLQKAQGDVAVRVGVTETWTAARVGDALSPDATVRTGKQSSAVILLPSANRKILLPAEVILDISDIRELTQEELMLKLTMEKVRSSSYEWKTKEMNIPGTTVVHGSARDKKEAVAAANQETGIQEMNGTRVLFENGFYSTGALRAMSVLRRYPSLGEQFENRLLVAQALEQANLKSEALAEYVTLSQSLELNKQQKDLVQTRIARLKR